LIDLTKLQCLLGGPAQAVPKLDIILRIVNFDYEYRLILRDLSRRTIRNIVLDLEPEETQAVLKMALQLGMINSSYHFILTTLVNQRDFFLFLIVKLYFSLSINYIEFLHYKDIETMYLDDYKYNRANLTALRLVKTDSSFNKAISLNLTDYYSNNLNNNEKNKILLKVNYPD
jgi:hypothetical protein